MARSEEWDEYHLTPKGWVKGSWKDDSSREVVAAPKDRVLTIRLHVDMDWQFRERRYETIEWNSTDEKMIAKLRRLFGKDPRTPPSAVKQAPRNSRTKK